MPLSLRYSAHSEVGLIRKNNQDSGYVSPTMLVVADGMGGAAAGDLASTVAIYELKSADEALPDLLADAERVRGRQVTDADTTAPMPTTGDADATAPLPTTGDADAAAPMPRADDPDATAPLPTTGDADATATAHLPLADDPDATAPETAGDLAPRAAALLGVLGAALARANEHLANLAADDAGLEGMGTTVCGFALVDGRLAVMNIGDSRAYLLRDGQLRRVTRDHSWVQTLVDEGRITEAEALDHPHRNLILKVLNGNPQHQPDLSFLDVKVGDRLLVCSDGLCGLVTDQQIARLVGDPDREHAVEALTALANEAGGYDNITIVVADLVDGPPDGTAQVLGAARTTPVPGLIEHTASLPTVDEPRPASPASSEEERYALTGRRGLAGWAKMLLVVLVPLLVVGAGGWGWYRYTQTQFYVGPADDAVAIYQGVPDSILGFDLSRVLRTDDTQIGDLPPYYAERVRQNIKVESLQAADATLEMLRGKAAKCVAQREARARLRTPPPTPSPTPTLTTVSASPPTNGPATPGASASPGASPTTPSPTPSPTQTQVTTPEDC